MNYPVPHKVDAQGPSVRRRTLCQKNARIKSCSVLTLPGNSTRPGSVWYADGRSERKNLGRHSLGVRDEAEARRQLGKLDRQMAEELGVAPENGAIETAGFEPLLLAEGRKLYEAHNGSRVTGGVKPSTRKKYRMLLTSSFHRHSLKALNVERPNRRLVCADMRRPLPMAASATAEGYAGKSIHNDLTIVLQTRKWLVGTGHLPRAQPLQLAMRKPGRASVPIAGSNKRLLPSLHAIHRTTGSLGLVTSSSLLHARDCASPNRSVYATLVRCWDVKRGQLQLIDETGHSGKAVKGNAAA